ncbi:MAG: hypothetical protein ACQEXV_01530 [Bacillota bacterium]
MNIREANSLVILKTIVHVIDRTQHQRALLSDREVSLKSMDSEVKKFILNHIKKSIMNNESKMAKFKNKTTKVQVQANNIIKDPSKNFVHSSKLIAQYLYDKSPNNSTPGCIVAVLYTDSKESFLALIKLDKNDSILYEENAQGDYELVHKGSTLPAPSKRTKLLKFATLRNTEIIEDEELDSRPGLIILDSQAEEFSRFFYKTFLESEFLLTDEHKSEKLMEGLNDFLKTSVDYSTSQKQQIRDGFAQRLNGKEEFNVEDAAQQILSPFLTEEFIVKEVKRLEDAALHKGMGDLKLKGVMTTKIMRKYFNIANIKTIEGVKLKFPIELLDTQVMINDSEEGDGKDIIIKNVHILEN